MLVCESAVSLVNRCAPNEIIIVHAQVAKLIKLGASGADFDREMAIQARISRHPHIVGYRGLCRMANGDRLLLMEYVAKGSLDKLVGAGAALDPRERAHWVPLLTVLCDVATALLFLHAQHPAVVHRDIAARNILVTGDVHGKLADFGMSRVLAGGDAVEGQTQNRIGPLR